MRYEDTSGTFNSAAAGTPDARDDSDNLAAGSRSPATGNAISGEGTITGAAGADIIGNAPGHIVALQGANGADTADSGGSLSAAGRFGTLTMNQDGGYSYRTSGPAPENARDVFSYTLADQSGARDTALLAIDIGHTPSVAANAQQIVPGADGVVTLPAGVELSDVHVVGRNLVIDMPDGSQMVIIDGAVFVPQLVLNGVEVPSSNLAALLVDSEPKPGAGTPQSGGGNFAVDVGPLDPGVPLGDLLPPTDLSFTPPEFEEPNQIPDDEPEILIIPDGQPGAVNAVDSVDESGLPERDGEPEGTLEPQAIESTTGVISISGDDDIDSVTINGVEIDSIGDTVETDRGILTITSIDLDSGEIGYSYTATDNTTDGVDDFDDFTVVVTDDDGDTATGTLHIDILDDEPIARDDTDSVTLDNPTAVGNVMTAVGTTNSPAGLDVVGADDATLTAVQGVGPADTTFDVNGNLVVQGLHGTLEIDAEGNYTYTRNPNDRSAGSDVFTYTLTDGDGDTETATLTITLPNINAVPTPFSLEPVGVDEDGLPAGNSDEGQVNPTEANNGNNATRIGHVTVDYSTDRPGDTEAEWLDAVEFINVNNLNGQLTQGDEPITFSVDGSGNLIGQVNGTGPAVVTIAFIGAVAGSGGNVTYEYQVTLGGPVDHDFGDQVEGFVLLEGIEVQVTDASGDTESGIFTGTIWDDVPSAEDVEVTQDPEDSSVIVDIDGHYDAGADGVDPDDISYSAVSGVTGSLSFNPANGQFSYVPSAGQEGDVVFTYTITDGDGDHITKTVTIHLADDSEPEVLRAADTLVDEDGLVGANVDGTPLRPGETDSTESATDSGAIAVDFKGDVPADLMAAITLVDSAALDGQLQTTDGDPIEFELDAVTGNLIGRANGVGDPLVIISITGAVAGSGGEVTYTYQVELLGPVEHPVPGSEDSIQLVGVGFEITDSDNDTATGSFDVTIVDDLPTAREPEPDPEHPNDPPPPLISGAVDEDDLPDGNDDVADGDNLPTGSSATVGGGAGSLATLFNAGADSPMQNFGLVDDTSGLPVLTSNGHDVLYDIDVDTGVLTAYADLDDNGEIDDGDASKVFTLTVGTDGSWSFALLGQLDHSIPGTEDNLLLDLSSIVSAEDADGDPVTAADGAFVIDVDDDMPQEFEDCPDDVITVNDVGSSFTGSLNLPPVGADDPGKVGFGVEDGDPVLDNEGDPITSNGQALFYFVNEEGVLEARAGDENGDVIFTITINGDGTFTYDQLGPITSETELSITDLDSVGGGNVDAKAIDVPDTPFDLILTTQPGNTVNTNNSEIGVGAGNSFQSGEILRVDLVQNAIVTGSGGGAVLNFGEYYTANSYKQDVSGLSPGQRASFTVKAIVVNEAAGSDLGDPADGDDTFFGDTNDTVVAVTTLTIYDDNGDVVTDLAGAGITVTDLGGGVWQIEGLPNDYDFQISSATAFNAVQIEAIDGTDTFKLGFIDITTVVQDEVGLSIPVSFTDADGDPVVCDIDINLGPPTNTPDINIVVDEAALNLIGSDPSSPDETQSGDLSSVVTGGTGPFTFDLIGPNADGNSPYGTLTLNPDGTYSFTLTAPFDGADANNGDTVENSVVTYTYEATDSEGVKSTGSIVIHIRDDVPTAEDDTDAIVEGETFETGNVMTGNGTTNDPAGDDVEGADGAEVTAATGFGGAGTVDGFGNITVVGQWGTVVIEPDGDYTYTLSQAGIDALEAKGEGQTLDAEVFNYTLTDGDGDQEGATLTISLTGVNDTPQVFVPQARDPGTEVFEAGLPSRNGGEPEGTGEAANPAANSDNSEITSGTFSYTPGDGATTITINGTPIDLDGPYPLAPIAGDYGNLVITGHNAATHVVSYTYTLTDNVDHDTDATPYESFEVTVSDSDGDSSDDATATGIIQIRNDVPIADNDTDVIDEGDISEAGNVITGVGTTSNLAGDDRVGADDAVVTGGSHPTGGVGTVGVGGNVTIVGQWGTVVIEPDGDYTYTLSPAGTTALNALGAGQTLAAEVFTYTLTDNDGDADNATLTITPTGANDNPGLNVPDTGADLKVVDEDALPTRSGEPAGTDEAADGNGADNDDPTETVTGTFTFTAGDGATTMTINGTSIDLDGPFPLAPIAGTYGSLTITNVVGTTVSYSYTLSDNINHNDANPDQDDFAIVVDDSDGTAVDAASDTLTIHITDDTPIADNDTDAIVEGETGETGNLITGAGTTSGAAGDDRVGADNSTVTAASGFGGAGTVGVGGNITVVGQWGTVVIEPDGDYTYTLSSAGLAALEAKGAGQTLADEVFNYTLKDGDNSTDPATLTITLTGTDDTPTLTVPDTGADEKIVDEAGLPARGSELAGTGEAANPAANTDNSEIVSGTFTFTPGDGATVLTIDGIGAGGPLTIPLAGPFPTAAIVGAHGSLVVTGVTGGTVSYTYTLTDNANHSGGPVVDDFTITVDDSDGSIADKVTDTLTIHITDDEPLDYQPDEAVMENTGTDTFTGSLDDDGTLANDGGADSIASLVWNTGAAGTILLNTDGDPVTVNGQPVKLYIQPDGSLKATTDNANPAMTVFTATLNPGASTYTIDFDRPLDNGSTSASDFGGASAGNNAWIGIDPDLVGGVTVDITNPGDPNPDSVDLLVTGFDRSSGVKTTVNRDSDDIGAGTGQANDPDESLRIDFVQDLRRDLGDDESDPTGFLYDTHVGQKVFTFNMVDPKAGGDTSVLLEAFNVTDGATAQSDVNAPGINTPVEIDPASIVVTDSGGNVLTAGVDYFVYDSGNGVYLSPISAGDSITFEAVGGATFEAVVITNANGHDIPGPTAGNFGGADFAIGGFIFGQDDPGDPVEFELPTLLTDGDGDTSDGTVPVTVYPVGQVPEGFAATTFSLAKTSALESQSLVVEDSGKHHRGFDANNNISLLGAIAAAGLASTSAAAESGGSDEGSDSSQLTSLSVEDGPKQSSDTDSQANHSLGGETQDAANKVAGDGGGSKGHSNDNGGDHSLTDGDAHETQAPSELLGGTDTPQQDAPAQSSFTSGGVAMPSAEMIAAAKAEAGSDGEAKSNAVVDQVVADALAGGGDGTDIDAVIDAIANQNGGSTGASEGLASQGHGGGSHWDIAGLGHFPGGHAQFTMESIQLHHDAVQPA